MTHVVTDHEPMIRGQEWQTQTVRDADTFGSLAHEWRDLHDNCEAATPFQSHDWLDSWWRAYGRPDRLRVVLVRHHGRLVGAAPFMAGRRWGVPVLSPVGTGLSDFSDVLVADGEGSPTIDHLARALLAEAGPRVIDLPEVRPSAGAVRVAEAWPTRTWRMPGSMCMELPGRPIETLVKTLTKSRSRRLRKKLNQVDRADLTIRHVPAEEVPDALEILMRLHELQWRGRGINPEHLRPEFLAHLHRSAPAMIEKGQAVLYEVRLDDRVVASELLLVGGNFVGGYIYGAHPDLRFLDVSTLLMRERLAVTQRLGLPIYSMLRGAEPYKMYFEPHPVPNERFLLSGTGRWPAMAYAAGVLGRAKAVRILRERLPSVVEALLKAKSRLADRRAGRLVSRADD